MNTVALSVSAGGVTCVTPVDRFRRVADTDAKRTEAFKKFTEIFNRDAPGAIIAPLDYAMSTEYFTKLAGDPAHEWTPREMLEGAIAWGSPHFRPGEGYGYAYSDTGYVLRWPAGLAELA